MTGGGFGGAVVALLRNEEVDRAGTRVVVGRGSAYDLFLTRELKSATLVRAPSSPEVTEVLLRQNYEVAAGAIARKIFS